MRYFFVKLLITISVLTGISCTNLDEKKVTESSQKSSITDIDKKVDSLLSIMTLEEKIGQMNQYNGFWDATGPAPKNGDAKKKYEHLRKGWVGSMLNVSGVDDVRAVQKIAVEESRLGIPLIIGLDVVHGYKTISPIPLAESASWDLEAIKKAAQVAAEEATAVGINWTFAPMVDITRDARWGRVMEGAGEDPYLGSKIAMARVQGFQGDDLSANNTLIACAKHFVGYGFTEDGKDYNTVDVGTSTLYNTLLPPFKASQDAGVRTFMNSFNVMNGIPATSNAFLQRDILKGTWEFDGFVVSDWGSIKETIVHGQAENEAKAAELCAKAGSDMDMESYIYIEHLAQLVNDGIVEESLIDDAVKRILKVKFELGLFNDPYKYCDAEREKTIGKQEYLDAVLDVAKKSIVLLKNDNKLLPLKKEGLNIALIGGLAADKDSPIGNWRAMGESNSAISVFEGMQQYTGNNLVYAKGAHVTDKETSFPKEVEISHDKSGFPEAISAAKKADVVVMVLGEHGLQSGEGRSRANLDLPGVQQELLEAIFQVNKNIVLVLNNGRPLAITWAAKNVPAIIEGWHLGSQSGNAIAQVLYGDYNPSGKLPMTFPRSVGQMPIYYNHKKTGRPVNPGGAVFWSHFIDESNEPLYPFGYGLSYSTFKYDDLVVDQTLSEVTVSVKLTNTSNIKGKEVVQLYIQDEFASITRPVKELKGFEMVELDANESKTINFKLTDSELGFFDNAGDFIVESGTFKVFVGGNSKDVIESSFEIQ